ncbi:hypothetical protein [Dyella mobilis]|uniref:Uncharacterized protein n=1 Tax=Dyella mobilis TaxID=1849582 RepID=A0ABS2KMB6_9GAMM|nr:hypothetical protein [Dyella mobilis]MBM7132266.1 hypothetical protein [Dyella mobilis]GLQ95749.1 hypothetical protein GCM10007863_01670 [Dyella mobilis]
MSFELAGQLIFPGEAALGLSRAIAGKYFSSIAEKLLSRAKAAGVPDTLLALLHEVGGTSPARWVPELEIAQELMRKDAIAEAIIHLALVSWPEDFKCSLDIPDTANFAINGVSVLCKGKTAFRSRGADLIIETMGDTWVIKDPRRLSPGVDSSVVVAQTGNLPETRHTNQGIYCLRPRFPNGYPPRPVSKDEPGSNVPVEEVGKLNEAFSIFKDDAPDYYNWITAVAAGALLGEGRGFESSSKVYPGLIFLGKDTSQHPYVEKLIEVAVLQYLYQAHMICDLYDPDDEGVAYNPVRNNYWTARKALVSAVKSANMIFALDLINRGSRAKGHLGLAISKYRFNLEVECAGVLNGARGLNENGMGLWEIIQRTVNTRSLTTAVAG